MAFQFLDLYICNFGNLCAFQLYDEAGKLLKERELVKIKLSEEMSETYTYESIVFYFLMELVQNIEKKYWCNVPDKKNVCRLRIHTMMDEPFFARSVNAPTTPAEKYLNQYAKDRMLLFFGLFDDDIIRKMAVKLKAEYDIEKANGTLAVFKTRPQAPFSDEWNDVYNTYT